MSLQFITACTNCAGSCVGVTKTGDGVIRIANTNNPEVSIAYSQHEFDEFIAGAKAGLFDGLTTAGA